MPISIPNTRRLGAVGSALTALLAASAAVAAPLTTEGRPLALDAVTLRWVPPDGDLYAGQTFDLVLEVQVAGGPEAAGLLQLFPQPLDVPLQVEAFAGLEGLELAPAREGAAPTVVVDGKVDSADGPFGDDGSVYRITRSVRARRPGAIDLPEATARFATATEFREDFVRGRVPVDRTEQSARGDAAALTILALPEDDRPFSFDGAIGRFTLETSVEPKAARVGETMRLVALVVGATPFDAVPAPRVESAEGFDVVGVRRTEVDGGTRFEHEIVPRSVDLTATPALTFTSFDPQASPAAYVTTRSEPHPIAVRAAAPREEVAARGNRAPVDPVPASVDEERPGLFWTPLVVGAILALLVGSTVRRRLARRPRTTS